MSVEIFKSMFFSDGKVFTEQASNNDFPQCFDMHENKNLTNLYDKLGEENFKKWFFVNLVMEGNVRILSDSNLILKNIDIVYKKMLKNEKCKELISKVDTSFCNSLDAKNNVELKQKHKVYEYAKKELIEYVTNFYDKYNNKQKNKEQER